MAEYNPLQKCFTAVSHKPKKKMFHRSRYWGKQEKERNHTHDMALKRWRLLGKQGSLTTTRRQPRGPPGTLLLALGAGGASCRSVVLSGLATTSFRHARNSKPASRIIRSVQASGRRRSTIPVKKRDRGRNSERKKKNRHEEGRGELSWESS